MVTAQQVFENSMDLMDKRSTTGQIDAAKTARYKVRVPNILTQWQLELAKNGDLYSTYEISNMPIANSLGLLNGFDIKEFIGIDLPFECNLVAKAYYFEVDGPGIVYIEDFTTQWNILATITVDNTVKSFKPYKGIVTPTTGATKSRMRASGTYYYRIVNRALFSIPFQADRIPNYRPWIPFKMPDDFKSVETIINEYPDRQYTKDSATKFEGKILYINYYYVGNVRIVYKPVPIPITVLTQTLQVDDVTAEGAAYFLASHLMLIENPETASFFNGRFMELKIEAQIKSPASITEIIDVYSLDGGYYV